VRKEEKKADAAVPEAQASVRLKNFERAVPPAILTHPQERADYLVAHFWDRFDFTDTAYCHAPEITEQAFVDFIVLFPHTSSAGGIAAGVDRLLNAAGAGGGEVMYAYFCRQAEHYLYDPNSPMRNDEYYIPFLEHIVNSSAVADVHKIRPQHQLELAYKNRTGARANDFVYTLASGRTGRLYALSAEYVLLMFYNPDCTECRHTVQMLKNTPCLSSGKVKVLAVYPDEDQEAWRQHAKDLPSAWINGHDRSQAIKKNEIYDLKAIPTLYLLDRDKKVILKDASAGDVREYLERHP
jgi:peroxiredoxin